MFNATEYFSSKSFSYMSSTFWILASVPLVAVHEFEPPPESNTHTHPFNL